MKTNCFFSVLLLGFATGILAQPGQPKDETFSENRKFSLEISETEINKPVLAVFSRTGSQSKLLWSRSLAPKDDLDDPNALSFGGGRTLRKTLSNDGSTVILRPDYANNEQPAVRVLTQKGGDAVFTAEDLAALVEDSIQEDYPDLFSNGGARLDLLLEAEKPALYAIWIPQAEQWLVFDLEKLHASRASQQVATRLDTLALAKAREIVRQSQGGGSMQQALNNMRRRAAAVLPGMVPDESNEPDYALRDVAYRFLASQKKPEDRPAIEKLLGGKITPYMSGGTPVSERNFGAYSSERVLGESLLAKWDGKELEDNSSAESSGPRTKCAVEPHQ